MSKELRLASCSRWHPIRNLAQSLPKLAGSSRRARDEAGAVPSWRATQFLQPVSWRPFESRERSQLSERPARFLGDVGMESMRYISIRALKSN